MSLCKRLLAHEALCRLSSFSRIYASFHPVCFPTTSQNAVRAARPFPLSGLFPLPNGKLCSPRERNKSGRLSKFAGLHCDTLSQLKRVFSTKTSLLQPPKGEHGKIALVRCILCIELRKIITAKLGEFLPIFPKIADGQEEAGLSSLATLRRENSSMLESFYTSLYSS